MIVRYVAAGILFVNSFTLAEGERYAKQHRLDPNHVVVIAEGDYEPRSIGSYSVRVYADSGTGFPADSYICGLIRERDGAVEDVLHEDVNGDGRKETVVTIRCVGSGSFLSADAFAFSNKSLHVEATVSDLPRDADVVDALRKEAARGKNQPDSVASSKQPACLLIEPVITRSSEGTEPAVSRIDREAVESVYARAGIRIAWLQPRYLDDTASRDGDVDVNDVVKIGRKRGLWGSGLPRLSLIFVSAINGKRGPRGLGMTRGPICFVAMPEERTDAAMETFCIAHELGHCLGLIHAVDDPEVPDDRPCIMGDGAFSERIGEHALMPPHVRRVRSSRLLLWSK